MVWMTNKQLSSVLAYHLASGLIRGTGTCTGNLETFQTRHHLGHFQLCISGRKQSSTTAIDLILWYLYCDTLFLIAPDAVNQPAYLKGTLCLCTTASNTRHRLGPVCSLLFTPFFYTRAASSPFIPSLTCKAGFTLLGQNIQSHTKTCPSRSGINQRMSAAAIICLLCCAATALSNSQSPAF